MKRLDKYIQESILDITDSSAIIKDITITQQDAWEWYDQDTIEEIVVPEGVVGLDDYAFRDYIKLRKISLPSTLTSIGKKAFIGCDKLEEVAFNRDTKRLKSIGENAFVDCAKLTQINLPDCIETIGEGAFKDCAGLTQLVLPKRIKNIGYKAFSGTSIIKVDVPPSFVGDQCGFAEMEHLKKIDLSRTRIKEVPVGLCSGDGALVDVLLPKTCTEIGYEAFIDCYSLKTLRAPNVDTIGGNAFKYCGRLADIEFAPGVSLGRNAFYYCSDLEEFTIPVSSLGYYPFENTNIKELYWTGEGKLNETQFQYDFAHEDDRMTKLNVLKPKNKLSGDARRQIEEIERHCEVTYADK